MVLPTRPPGRVPGVRRLLPRLSRVDPQLVLFDSWRGKFSDSPRAISETLLATRPDLRQVWVLEGDDPLVPDGVERVAPAGRAHLAALGRAGYVVANSGMPLYWRKRPGQRYLQTWHGTPVKKVAYDIARPRMRDARRYLRHFRRDVAAWDVLLSQNPFSSRVLRRAFRFAGPVAETGYPRNDALRAPDAGAVRAATRRRLGLAAGQRAVLYAPTWRDGDAFELALDLGGVAAAAGPDVVVLLRAHNNVARTVVAPRHPRVRDVSRVPDVRELLLAADVLVTDYSSVMFDFAVTGRPILLFTYDIEHYRDELRGLYLDLAAEAPSPLLRTPGELVDALRGLDALAAAHAEDYRRFRARYLPFDDGAAAARAAGALLAA